MMTAPEPRCDSTAAMFQSVAYDGCSSSTTSRALHQFVQSGDRCPQGGERVVHCSSFVASVVVRGRKQRPGLRSTRSRPAPSRACIHQTMSSASMVRRGSSEARNDRAVRILRLAQRNQHVGQDVHGPAQRRHLELHRHLTQLLDGTSAPNVAPADKRDRLAPQPTKVESMAFFSTAG